MTNGVLRLASANSLEVKKLDRSVLGHDPHSSYGCSARKTINSPVVALNRAVAVANVHGARAGIQAVEAIHNLQQLNGYYLLYAVLDEFEADLDHREAAMKHFRKALELATMKSEQNFLAKKIQQIENPQKVRRIETARPSPKRALRNS